MPLDKQAKSYLWDIHQAAREIKEFLHGVKFHEFEKNKVLPHSQKEPRYYVLGHTSLEDVCSLHLRCERTKSV